MEPTKFQQELTGIVLNANQNSFICILSQENITQTLDSVLTAIAGSPWGFSSLPCSSTEHVGDTGTVFSTHNITFTI